MQLIVRKFISSTRHINVSKMFMHRVIVFDSVTVHSGSKAPLLEDAKLEVNEGNKLAVIGVEKEAREAVLNLICRTIQPDKGSVVIEQGKKVVAFTKPISVADQRLTINEYFLSRGCSSHFGSMLKILEYVKLSANVNRTISSLSTSDKAKVKLAAVLMEDPDILILNEPTKLFDHQGLLMLSTILKDFKKTVVVNSQDEDFLSSFTNATAYVDPATMNIAQYFGTYEQSKLDNAKLLLSKRVQTQIELNANSGKLPDHLDLNDIGRQNVDNQRQEVPDILIFNTIMLSTPFALLALAALGAFNGIY